MAGIGRYDNPFRSIDLHGELPPGARSEVVGVTSDDNAYSHGALWMPAGERPSTVVTLMHPRADFLRHYTVPGFLEAGHAVWCQNSRWVGNDATLIHEHLLLDVAAGMRYLREVGFVNVVPVGNSGGGSLFSFYIAQAHADAGARLTDTAAGAPFDLNAYELPGVEAMVFLAAHQGEGLFLAHAIDPAVTDEDDPLSCDPDLDMFDPANGFRVPPEQTRYTPDFVERYRGAQRDRVRRIDDRARAMVATRLEARRGAKEDFTNVASVRGAIAVPYFRVYRTDADPRAVDLRLDSSDRDYGSLWGYRPDLINYGPVGFARVVTPDAWLSTWSANASRAEVPDNAAAIDLPTLVVSYTADNAVFPSDAAQIFAAVGSDEKDRIEVGGDHYGFGEPGRAAAVAEIATWLERKGL